MATKLQCEICGGRLVGKPGGIFECENCGMEFSTEWAKAKIQEISGTVKVEGTVEVQGTVKVEGSATTESLLKRGFMALEDRQWEEAGGVFEQVLKGEPENAQAYLGLAMANRFFKNKEALKREYLTEGSSLPADRRIARARQFGEEVDRWFAQLDEEIRAAEQRKLEEKKLKRE